MPVKTKHKQVELFVIYLTLAGLAEQFVVEVYLQFWTNVERGGSPPAHTALGMKIKRKMPGPLPRLWRWCGGGGRVRTCVLLFICCKIEILR